MADPIMSVHSLSNKKNFDQISDWSKLKAFAEVFKCWLPAPTFPTIFSKASFSGSLKGICMVKKLWLVGCIRVYATLRARVISTWSVMHLCFLAFSHQYWHNFLSKDHQLLFSYASAEVRSENTLERKSATGYQTHKYQVMSLTTEPPWRCYKVMKLINHLLHRYSFWHIKSGKFLKTHWKQCFLLNQEIVFPFVHIFDIMSLFAAKLEEPKIGIWGTALRKEKYNQCTFCFQIPIVWFLAIPHEKLNLEGIFRATIIWLG